MSKLPRLLIILICLLILPVLARAEPLEKRVALVIGNGAYQTGALATAANDAGLVAQTLQAAGFDVVGARDLDTAALRASFRDFLDKANATGPDTVALVYFSGYGLQYEGENYLVPIDARIERDADVPLAAIRVSDLTRPLAALNIKARIVVLDAAYPNGFAKAGQPLAGGLALMQPDPGTLIAFNAAPGTIGSEGKGPYGAYATSLSEMIKEGGLPLDALFERVRLRVDELTHGGELPWQVSRIDKPFLFFERSNAAPQPTADRFSELGSKPIKDFDAHDAYLAALARDTMRGYLDFLAAYPRDPLAKRVRVIVAARREAATWHESAVADTPDAYWSYLRRYARGPHAHEARRRLAHFAAALEPPASFTAIDYDVPPPPEEEIVYVERPVVYFADPVYELPPPPPVPVFFLPPRPVYFVELPPPPPPIEEYVLPIPIYHPVPLWVERPRYVAPPPVNVINVNIHNTVVANPTERTVVVTDPAGHRVEPLPTGPAGSVAPQPTNVPPVGIQQPGPGPQSIIQAHPVASAAAAAAAVALPAALRARQLSRPASLAPGQVGPSPRPGVVAPPQAPNGVIGNPAQRRPLPLPQPGQRPGATAVAPVQGGRPLPVPDNTAPQTRAPNGPVINPAQRTPLPQPQSGRRPGALVAPPVQGARPLPTPGNIAPQPGRRPGLHQPQNIPETARGTQPARPARPPGAAPMPSATPAISARPGAPAAQQRAQDVARQRAEQAAQQRAQQAGQQRAQRAAQERAQQATQQRAQQAAQQRAQQAAQQAAQQRAQQAAQQRAQQAAQQRAMQAAQQRAQQAAQQRAQQAAQQRAMQAAQQRARAPQQNRQACGRPGTPPCR